MAIRYNSGAARGSHRLKQMPIKCARTHKTGAGGMSASLIGHSGAFRLSTTTVSMPRFKLSGGCPLVGPPMALRAFAIGLEKYVSIKRTAERAVGIDRIPLDPGRVIKTR